MAQKSGENLQLPTEEELGELSLQAIVAYATRCALRVLPLVREPSQSALTLWKALLFSSLISGKDEKELRNFSSTVMYADSASYTAATKAAVTRSDVAANAARAAARAVDSAARASAARVADAIRASARTAAYSTAASSEFGMNQTMFITCARLDYERLQSYRGTDRPVSVDFYSRPLWYGLDESEVSGIEKFADDWVEWLRSESGEPSPGWYMNFFESRRYREIPWDSIEAEVRQWLAELESENTGDDEDISIPDQESSELGREFSTAGKMFDTHNLNGAAISLGGSMSNEDLLGRESLVNALANMIASPGQDTPFTIGLLGDWGSGKSNVMYLLRKVLEERTDSKRFYFADFNAWEYEHTDNMAAGVAQEVLKAFFDEKPPKEKDASKSKSESTKKGEKKKTERLSGIKKFWWMSKIRVKFGIRENGRLVPIFMLVISVIAIISFIMIFVRDSVGWIAAFGASTVVLAGFIKRIFNILEHPLTAKINNYLKLPSYVDHLGTIPMLKRHLQTLCDLIIPPEKENPKRLIVFVDDLDRCEPHAISKTLDAIRLVMDIPNVVVMIGIDHRIAFRAVEKQYVDLADDERTSADIARDYLGKIIQLPVMLNRPDKDELENFISKKLFSVVEEEVRNVGGDNRISAGNVDHDDSAGTDETEKIQTGPSTGDGTENSVESKESNAESILNQIKTPVIKDPQPPSVQSQADESTEMTDTYSEKIYFSEMCSLFDLHNPRQLIRLRNCYRLLKRIVRPSEEEWRPQMMLLFWLEFLYAQQQQTRMEIENCFKDKDPGKLNNILQKKGFDQNLSETIAFKLNLQKDDFSFYERIVKEVKRLVLPHSESAKRAKEESEAPVVDGSPDQKKGPEDKP